jgi:hypothetical protein
MKNIYLIIIGILVSFSLFSQDYSQVYLIGGATPNAWDNGNAQKMTLVESTAQSAIFTWTGALTASDYKFINALYTWMPCFNAATANESVVLGQTHSLVYNQNNNAIDYKFTIGIAGNYTVTVDLKKLTMVVTQAAQSEIPVDLWVTGSAIFNGTQKLTKGFHNYNFLYGGELKQGNLKFMSTEVAGASTKYYVPVEEDTDITGKTSFRETSDPTALGWSVMVDDPTYKIKLNLLDKTSNAQIINSNKKLYMVGGATTAGWNAGNGIELLQDKQNIGTYIFDGELKIRSENAEPNAFKILGQLNWDPYSLHAVSENASVMNTTFYEECINGSFPDYKWTINDSQQGRYIIKVNTVLESIETQYIGNESAVKEIENNKYFQVQSVSDGIKIRMLDNSSADSVQLISIEGRNIYSIRNAGKEVVLRNNIGKGVYILEINCHNKLFTQQVLIK